MAPEPNTEPVATPDYDVVVHEVMDRLTHLGALSTNVEQTRREASDALALLGGVAPLLQKIADDASVAGAQITSWQTSATADMRRAFQDETGLMQHVVADVDERWRNDRDAAANVLRACQTITDR